MEDRMKAESMLKAIVALEFHIASFRNAETEKITNECVEFDRFYRFYAEDTACSTRTPDLRYRVFDVDKTTDEINERNIDDVRNETGLSKDIQFYLDVMEEIKGNNDIFNVEMEDAVESFKQLHNGVPASLSMMQICNLVTSLADAKVMLPADKYNEILSIYNSYQGDKQRVKLDALGYIDKATEIIEKYEKVAPYALFDGNHPEIDVKTVKLIWDLFDQGYTYKEMINMYPEQLGTPLQ